MSAVPAYIHFTSSADQTLSDILNDFHPDKVAVLVDELTKEHCYPKLPSIANFDLIEIKSGEKNKTLDTCQHIWSEMTRFGFTRKSLLINLGGGVIGDMGGFVAATYKRGIRFINLPTTLLSQVDASIGGKLGVDFQGLKNHIGVFKDPDAVILCSDFLETLPPRQLRSGYAEVIKHGLIWDKTYWSKTKEVDFPTKVDWEYLLRRSVEIKGEVVTEDPLEGGLRKILNFGHTLGHAIETWHLDTGRDLLHGEAVAAGMIMEGWLSVNSGMIDQNLFDQIVSYLDKIYPRVANQPNEEELFSLLAQDKKNEGTQVLFALVNGAGSCQYDVSVSREDILKAVSYYFK